MNINDQISTMTKPQAAYVMAVAKRRIEELDKEKMESLEMLVSAYQSHEKINFFGQDLHITNRQNTIYENITDKFVLENGSVIVIESDFKRD